MSDYNKDFYEWTQCMAPIIRSRDLSSLSESDLINIEDEIKSLGNRDKIHAKKLITNIMSFILIAKEKDPVEEEWINASLITHQQQNINAILDDSPSIKKYLEENLDEIYGDSISLFEKLSDWDGVDFPEKCPFKLDQLLSAEFALAIRPKWY